MFRIEIEGHVGRNPEMRYLEDGTAVTSFSVAVNWTEKGERKTKWIRCSARRDLDDKANQHLMKADLVRVRGSARTRLWRRDDGTMEKSLEVNITGFEKIGYAAVDVISDRDCRLTAMSVPLLDTGYHCMVDIWSTRTSPIAVQ